MRQRSPSAGDAQRLLAGIPQHGTVLGKPSAPVTMTEWIDLQCPYCQQFETQALPVLIRKYVRTGKLKIDARLIGFLGPDSHRGRLAALAAGKQNKLFNLAELLYYNQGPENTGWLNDDLLASAAASIPGLDAERMLSERNSSQIGNEANALDQAGTGARRQLHADHPRRQDGRGAEAGDDHIAERLGDGRTRDRRLAEGLEA